MVTAIPATASEWIVRLSGGPLTEAENQALAQWIESDSTRIRELEEASIVWRLAGRAAAGASEQLQTALHDAKHSQTRAHLTRRLAVGGGFAVAASICLMVMLQPRDAHHLPQLANGSNVQTAIGQVERYALPDTSSVTIAADSAVAVNFSETRREVALDRGEVFLKVAHEGGRPFTVTAGTHNVTVTGTKFNVDFDSARDELEVAVAEGSVNVGLGANGDKIEKLTAGDVVSFQASGQVIRRKITPEQAAAWREGSLYFDQTSVREALLQMNRYAAKPIVVTDDKIMDLTLTGRFEARNTTSFIYALEAIFGVKAQETDRAWELSLPI